jgi:maltooligosyltrehalose trehalohydrolase
VRRFFVDNACMWLRDYHFDGLRLDAVHAFADASAVTFLEQLSTEVAALSRALGRLLVLIAESDLNDPRLVRERGAHGYGLDAQWSDDLHHALHAALTGERNGYYADFGALGDIVRTLREGYAYGGRYSGFRQRTHGRPFGELPGYRLLGYLQTHDQVGNRARGDRIAALTTPGRARIGAAIALCAPFVPMLFQGEEWSASSPFCYFTDHQDQKLAKAVREGRKAEFAAFGWAPQDVPDPQAVSTFRGSVLDWDERQRDPHAGMLQFYRELIALRRGTPDLLDGDLRRVEAACDEQQGWLTMRRGAVTLQANLGPAEVVLPAPPGRCVLAYPSAPEREPEGVSLLPDACAVWVAG